METNYINLILVFFILVLLSRGYIFLAKRFGIADVPNERSSHSITVIRGGGILFPLGAILYFVFSGFEYPFFFCGLIVLAAVSFIDDIKSLSVKQRIPVQLGAIALTLVELGVSESIGIGIIAVFGFLLLAVLALVFVNCFNFIDGINGMLGFYGLSVLIPLLIVNMRAQVIQNQLLVFLILATLVFGYYNFRKRALFFSGDVGSISLGLILFFILIKFIIHLKAPVLLLFGVVFLTDTLSTIFLRIIKGKSIFKASRDYMYERMVNEVHVPHLKISAYYAIFQIIISMMAVYLYKSHISVQLTSVGIVLTFTTVLFFFLNHKVPKDSSALTK